MSPIVEAEVLQSPLESDASPTSGRRSYEIIVVLLAATVLALAVALNGALSVRVPTQHQPLPRPSPTATLWVFVPTASPGTTRWHRPPRGEPTRPLRWSVPNPVRGAGSAPSPPRGSNP